MRNAAYQIICTPCHDFDSLQLSTSPRVASEVEQVSLDPIYRMNHYTKYSFLAPCSSLLLIAPFPIYYYSMQGRTSLILRGDIPVISLVVMAEWPNKNKTTYESD